MARKILAHLIAVAALTSACGAPAMRETESANHEVKVEVLTEFDGIRLYRIDTGNKQIYVAVSVNETRASSEDCHYDVATKTEQCDQVDTMALRRLR